MSVLYNLEIFSALRIVYGSKTDGFSEDEFDRNKQGRGLYVPDILRYFLMKYGYMPLNRLSDSVRLLHPNLISEREFRCEANEKVRLTIIGRMGDYHIAFADKRNYDPSIYMVKQTPNDVQVMHSDDTVSEIIKVMLCTTLLKNPNAVVTDNPDVAMSHLRENGVDVRKITNNAKLRREYSLCFTEETRTFTIAEYVNGAIVRFFFVRDEQFVNK